MSLKPGKLNEIREFWENQGFEAQINAMSLVDEIFRLRAVLERIETVFGPGNRLIISIVKEALEK